ncbi:hypothetical protein CRUP_006430, partial [Coryphaenoides rupestris]
MSECKHHGPNHRCLLHLPQRSNCPSVPRRAEEEEEEEEEEAEEPVCRIRRLLGEKRGELGEQVSKLRSGLFKIDDTRQKVQAMSLELGDAKGKVADFQLQCEEYLFKDTVHVHLNKKSDGEKLENKCTHSKIARRQPEPRHEAALRRTHAVGAHSEKIGAEEVKCKAMAENAQRDLDKALPTLEEAMKALESLNKKDMTEIKSYGRPPALVETVMQAVMILLGKEPTWAEAKRQLGESSFIKTLVNFDKDNISDRVLKRTGQYCTQADFQPDIIGRVSLAAKSLCMWVRAMEGLEESMGYLTGDCLLAASCLSYLGPFLSGYRDQLVAIWMTEGDDLELRRDRGTFALPYRNCSATLLAVTLEECSVFTSCTSSSREPLASFRSLGGVSPSPLCEEADGTQGRVQLLLDVLQQNRFSGLDRPLQDPQEVRHLE